MVSPVVFLAAGAVTAALLSGLLPEDAALAGLCQGDAGRAAVLRAGLAVGAALVLHNLPEGVLTLFSGAADPALGRRTAEVLTAEYYQQQGDDQRIDQSAS